MRVSGVAEGMVAASPAACRAVLVDLAGYPEWCPGVRAAELLEPGKARLTFRTGLPVLAEIECVLELAPRGGDGLQPTTHGGALRIDGPGWTLTPQPAGPATHVKLEIGVEMGVPGGFVTERLIRGQATHFLIDEPVAALGRRLASST